MKKFITLICLLFILSSFCYTKSFSQPTLVTTPSSLKITSCRGNGNSIYGQVIESGQHLTSDVTVACSANLLITADGTSFNKILNLPQINGQSGWNVGVQFDGSFPFGAQAGTVTFSSQGAETKTVMVTGFLVNPPTLSIGNINSVTTSATQFVIPFNASGADDYVLGPTDPNPMGQFAIKFGPIPNLPITAELPQTQPGDYSFEMTTRKVSDDGSCASAPVRFSLKVTASPLPVSFLFFKHKLINNCVNLTWKIGDAIELRSFEIERSDDGLLFYKVGSIIKHGGDSYSWTGGDMLSGTSFFRIKALTNGKDVVSEIIKVNNLKSVGKISCYPNPILDDDLNLTFATMKAGAYHFYINDTNGRCVMTGVIKHNGESASYIRKLKSNISDGLYILNFVGPDFKEINQKLVIARNKQ